MNTMSRYRNGDFIIINCYGDVIAKGNTREAAFAAYAAKYDCTIEEAEKEIVIDNSSVLYNFEYDTYMTVNMLREEYNQSAEIDKELYPFFSDYLLECIGKNGTLEEV